MKEFMALNNNLKLRMLTVFLAVMLSSSIGPNMTIYYAKYFGAGLTGVLLIIVSVMGFIAGLYGGHLADVHGRKPIMVLGTILTLAGFALAAVMNSPLGHFPMPTFFAFLIAQVGANLSSPAEEAMVIDVSTPQNRRYVYALIYWIINISVMIGAALGGWFFRDYLFELLIGMGVVTIINLIIIWFFMSESFTPDHAVSGSVWQAVRGYWQVMSDHRYDWYLIGMVLSGMVTNQLGFYLAVHLGADFHTVHLFGLEIYGQRMLSGITLINTAIIIPFMSLFTRLTSKWSLRRAYTIGMGLQTLGFALTCMLNTLWPIVICAVILTVGEMVVVPPSQTLRADLMDPAKIGTYSGAFSAVYPLASVLAGATVTLSTAIGQYGMAILFLLLGGCSIAAVIHVLNLPKAAWNQKNPD